MLAVAHRLETIMEFDQAAWTVKGCSLGSVHVLQVLQVQVSKSIVEIRVQICKRYYLITSPPASYLSPGGGVGWWSCGRRGWG